MKKGVKIVSGNGRVALSDAGGPSSIRTSFGPVEAARIGGDLTAESSNSPVRATDVKGGASVRTSFGAVVLEGIAGRIEVDDQNGAVDVKALPAAAART